MRIIGCDLHARQQTLAMLDTGTGEVMKMTLKHEGNRVREFYSGLPRPVRVGIEATGSMQWFVNLMEELGVECLVGHPTEIRAAEPRKQKHDRRDADLLLSLLVEQRFPTIWLPTKELLDLRALLRHRHQWVCLRVKYRTRCKPLPWRMASAGDLLYGAKQANTRSRLCRCRHMPLIGGMSCRRCM
jgi:transposase